MDGSTIERADKPTADDIKDAIAAAETGDWIDPSVQPGSWYRCTLYDPEGQQVGDGDALTRGMAMGLAWLHHWASDALIAAYVEPNSVPLEVSAGFRFELTAVRAAELDAWGNLRADPSHDRLRKLLED
jgi:hypothetical protein